MSSAKLTGAEELCRLAAEANARSDTPDWRVDETICVARSNISTTRGAFDDAARFAEQAAGIARAGGDLADASIWLAFAASSHLLVNDIPGAVPLAREALALARQTGAPALIASGLLAVGASVAFTDPEHARACLRESRELSTALGYQSAIDLVWATAVAFILGDWAATLEFGASAIHGLQRGGDRLRMGMVLYFIAGALVNTQLETAAIVQGAADTNVLKAPDFAQLISLQLTAALGEERAQELRARGGAMNWDQTIAYTLNQITQTLNDLVASFSASPERAEAIPELRVGDPG